MPCKSKENPRSAEAIAKLSEEAAKRGEAIFCGGIVESIVDEDKFDK